MFNEFYNEKFYNFKAENFGRLNKFYGCRRNIKLPDKDSERVGIKTRRKIGNFLWFAHKK